MIASDVSASIAPGARRQGLKGLQIQRLFTKPGVDPLSQIEWERRRSEIRSPDGKKIIFEMNDVEAPKSWSQTAVDIAADKYLRKAGVPTSSGRETSIRSMVDRVARAIRLAGESQGGYFASEADADAFEQELRFMLANQFGAFNSPVWFNVGLAEAYGIKGKPSGNFVWDHASSTVVDAKDSYSRPAASACFIVSVEDDLIDIAQHVEREMRIFRFGGGSGGNYSRLRAEGESLSNGGVSSGLMSFLKIFDVSAGAIKSGGTTRRAAKLVCLDVDHPDVEKFIDWKVREEEKALALIKAGYPADFNGEAYQTVSGQNANNSIRLSDEFMMAVLADGPWLTKWRTSGSVAATLSAKKLFRKIADAAHRCADPGVMFDTTINRWNPVINTGRIEAANPCQPAWATVLTKNGISTIGEIGPGDVIWSGQSWTKVTKKWSTGVKPVYAFKTRGGVFNGTENHRVVQNGEKIEVKDAEAIDIAPCFDFDRHDGCVDAQAVMDGLVIGDGTIHKLCPNLPPVLLVGEKDRDYFTSEVKDLFVEERQGVNAYAWSVKTTIERSEMARTWEREIPVRYLCAQPKIVRSFLRGLYSANGSVVATRVTLKAASLKVIEAAQQMLSSLGIRSYYTTNREHDVEFENGTYTCKQSYDLNVGPDRVLFRDLIGFIQKDKQERLNAICDGRESRQNRAKTTYEIVEREFLGEEEVFDLTVEADEHTYWTGGLLVSNCNEFHFLPDTACNLSSLNVMKFMTKKAGAWQLDVASFRHAARVFTLAKEIIVDYASYPTKAIARNSHDYRPLGLGYANLGASLMVQGLPYDSADGCSFNAALNSVLCGVAYETSAEIAASKGAFPGFERNREPMLKVIGMHRDAAHCLPDIGRYGEIVSEGRRAWDSAVALASKHGVRNAQVTVTAPTGTIGLMMDCDTTGIEPDFSLVKHKKMAGGGYLKIVNRSIDPALEALGYDADFRSQAVKHVLEHGSIEGMPGLKPEHLPIFDCANKCGDGKRYIGPMGHVQMLAAVQPFVSGSISKTVNCPAETTVEEIEAIYMEAWKRGLKCIAVYRDKSKHSQILDTKKDGDEKKPAVKVEVGASTEAVVTASRVVRDDRSKLGPPPQQRHRLPKKRPGGFTQELKIGDQKLYLRTGEYCDGSLGELFIDMHKDGAVMHSLMNCFSIAISLGLQHGVPLREFVKAFAFTNFSPSGVVDHPNVKTSTSVLDAVFRVLAFEYLGEEGLEFVHVRPTDDELAEMCARKAKLLAIANGQSKASNGTAAASYKNGSGTASFKRSKVEGQACSRCGNLTVRTGTCSTCASCGFSTGCA